MKDIHKEFLEVVSSLKGHLIYQRDVLLAEGVSVDQWSVVRGQGSERKVQSWELGVGSSPHPGPLPQGAREHLQSPLPSGERIEVRGGLHSQPPTPNSRLLAQLRAEIGDCRMCRLGKTRTNLVFGVGDPDAKIVFVGEGPGRDEDLKGEPFVGRAGQLLTDIITKGMKMRREDVYICNVIKCRPPGNRNPGPDEIDACKGFLERQLDIIRPEVIVALGTFAAKTLLNTDLTISQLRGRFHDYKGIKVMPTYHPAYLLRNPEKKKETWEDIKMVMAEMNAVSS